MFQHSVHDIDDMYTFLPIGTSYLAKFPKGAVTNLKNYSTKNDENLRKPKGGQ